MRDGNVTIEMQEQDLGTLCICAVRYCQGRETYMPDLVRCIVRPLLQQISYRDLKVMFDDCEFQRKFNLYGDEKIDKPGWLKWKQELKEELARRDGEELITSSR